MEKVIIKFKRLGDSTDLPLPCYESEGSSGMDIRACVKEPVILQPGQIKLIPTGLAISIPFGYEAQMRPRSGLALKHGIGLVNSPGTIDSDYRGEVKIAVINLGAESYTLRRGDRIAQMVIHRVYQACLKLVEKLDQTERNTGGFGHTGRS